MRAKCLFVVGLLVGAGGCAEITDANAPYTLTESSSSSGGAGGGDTGGMGGMGGSGIQCATDADCPATGQVCAVAACTNGKCVIENVTSGTSCIAGMPHVCDGKGACVECTLAAHCVNIVEDDCTKRACVDNACQAKHLGQDTPASLTLQQPGDCKKVVCDGVGGVKPIHDDTDTPDDGNGCTVDGCTNGTMVFTKVATGTSCGVNSYCNSIGQCVGCLQPSDCTGSFDVCQKPTCGADGVCGVDNLPEGTPAGNQTAHDCKKNVCDGAGNVVAVVDMDDIPEDANACTEDSCSAEGTPSNSPVDMGTMCSVGDNDVCDGLGACKLSNGKPCSAGSECVSTFCIDGVCCENACNGMCSACNVSPATAGTCTLVPPGQEDGNATMPCMGGWTCDGNGGCKKESGQTCAAQTDCLSGFCVDGYCCDGECTATCKSCGVAGQLGTCVNIPLGTTDNNATTTCNGANVCNGAGLCKLANGQPCIWDSQCASNDCHNGQDKCVP